MPGGTAPRHAAPCRARRHPPLRHPAPLPPRSTLRTEGSTCRRWAGRAGGGCLQRGGLRWGPPPAGAGTGGRGWRWMREVVAGQVAGAAGGTGGLRQVRSAGRAAGGAGSGLERRPVGWPAGRPTVPHLRTAPVFPPDPPRRGCGRPSPMAGGVGRVGLVVAVVGVGAPAPAPGAGSW